MMMRVEEVFFLSPGTTDSAVLFSISKWMQLHTYLYLDSTGGMDVTRDAFVHGGADT